MTEVVIFLGSLALAFYAEMGILQKWPRFYKPGKTILLIIIGGACIANFIKTHKDSIQQNNIEETTKQSKRTIDSLEDNSKILWRVIDTFRSDTREGINRIEAKVDVRNARDSIAGANKLRLASQTSSNTKTHPSTPYLDILATPKVEKLGGVALRVTYLLGASNGDARLYELRYVCLANPPFNDPSSHAPVPDLVLQSNLARNKPILPKGVAQEIHLSLNLWPGQSNRHITEPFILVIECGYKSLGNVRHEPMRKAYYVSESTGLIKEVEPESYANVSRIYKEAKVPDIN